MSDLSDDEVAVLRFLHDQPRGEATHVQAADENRYLRVEKTENLDAVRGVLEGLADRGYVELLPGAFSTSYRLTERGDQALADLDENAT